MVDRAPPRRKRTPARCTTRLAVFFFSSRRRHTIFDCDWSSDVCSSDLLAACTSDVVAAVYDEALTPATAFLAAGAVTVVGARWQVRDSHTMLLMFMFHYFMAHHACSPRDALRCAQQWMLDPCRTAPPEMPPELARHTRAGGLSKVIAWAAFVHQGR